MKIRFLINFQLIKLLYINMLIVIFSLMCLFLQDCRKHTGHGSDARLQENTEAKGETR